MAEKITNMKNAGLNMAKYNAFIKAWKLPENYPVSTVYETTRGTLQVRLGYGVDMSEEDVEDQDEDDDGPFDLTISFSVTPHPNCCGMTMLYSFYTYEAKHDHTKAQLDTLNALLDHLVSMVSEYNADNRHNLRWPAMMCRDQRVELIAVRTDGRGSGGRHREDTKEPIVDDASKFNHQLFLQWLFTHKVTSAEVFLNTNSLNYCQRMTVLL